MESFPIQDKGEFNSNVIITNPLNFFRKSEKLRSVISNTKSEPESLSDGIFKIISEENKNLKEKILALETEKV
jgi:hypothetical protein